MFLSRHWHRVEHAQIHPVGTPIRIRGLQTAAQHNDRLGEVIEFDATKGRYAVKLRVWQGTSQHEEWISVKPANLCLISQYAQLSNNPSSRQSYLPTAGQVDTALDTAVDRARIDRLDQLHGEGPAALPDPVQEEQGPTPRERKLDDLPCLWTAGDNALYRCANGEQMLVKIIRVCTAPMAADDEPSVVVCMPDGAERDTTMARLSSAPEPEPEPAVPVLSEPVYSYEWQDVPAGASVPPGMAYTLPLGGQTRRARIPPQWRLQLWSEALQEFYRLDVQRTSTIALVERELAASKGAKVTVALRVKVRRIVALKAGPQATYASRL